MSPRNWTICPKCARAHLKARDEAFRKANELYGKVPVEEYQAALKKAQAMPPTFAEEGMREDYHFGFADDGMFTLRYSCYCEECGFRFDFKHSEVVPDAKGEKP